LSRVKTSRSNTASPVIEEQLPALAADLVQRQVRLDRPTTTPAAFAAKAAITTIPMVFEIGFDPVEECDTVPMP